MLLLGQQGGCMPYTIILVAALATGNPLLHQAAEEEEDEDEDEEEEERKNDDYESGNKSNKEKEAIEKKKELDKEKEKRRERRRKINAAHNVWKHPDRYSSIVSPTEIPNYI